MIFYRNFGITNNIGIINKKHEQFNNKYIEIENIIHFCVVDPR